MRRTKASIFLGIAGLLAVATAFLVRAAIDSERANAARPPVTVEAEPGTHVLVAARDLMPGQFVRPDRLRWQSWPDDDLADTYVVKGSLTADDFTGAVVRSRLVEGEPVTEGRLVRAGDQGFLAAVLTPGKRAVSVPVNATSGIAGFIFPGDRVDVILTHTVRVGSVEDRVERRASETVLEDIRVLAIDQRTEDVDGKPQVGKTATLEVTAKQAEIITLVDEVGKLSLSLRSLAVETEDGQPADASRSHARRTRHTWDSEVSRVLGGAGRVINVLRASESESLTLGGGAR
ncbi:MAG: Flp pilus assembly protein CpaB [Alphaproteobacteria bacterium]